MFTKEDKYMILAMKDQLKLNKIPWWKFSERRTLKKSISQSIESAMKENSKTEPQKIIKT